MNIFNSSNNKNVIFKQVKFYNLWLLIRYILIRYKIFVLEQHRPIIKEFYIADIKAAHYLLFAGIEIIGTGRIIYENHIALLKEYRNQGYGAVVTKALINIVKKAKEAKIISLFAEDKKIKFYKKFGFVETEMVLNL
ncbi:GNAT family N-acetyltransferase [Rickettsia endosymbiont of Halotydeus destructor]|uniref:GNAT family N-acetyltransferase n=1 Tax=Rickettsia endosymbiont of Halotydeus destructor TaxID=2996754 RepID=UPI003BAE5F8E